MQDLHHRIAANVPSEQGIKGSSKHIDTYVTLLLKVHGHQRQQLSHDSNYATTNLHKDVLEKLRWSISKSTKLIAKLLIILNYTKCSKLLHYAMDQHSSHPHS